MLWLLARWWVVWWVPWPCCRVAVCYRFVQNAAALPVGDVYGCLMERATLIQSLPRANVRALEDQRFHNLKVGKIV